MNMNWPLVATNEAFFPTPADYEAHDALMAVAQNTVIAVDERRRLTPDHCFKSRGEIIKLFADIPEALENTLEIARRCSAIVEQRDPILPRFTAGEADEDEVAALAMELPNSDASRSKVSSNALKNSAWPKVLIVPPMMSA